jgi:hypothetical protein
MVRNYYYIDRLERILTMVYVVQSYWACFGLYPSETGSDSVLRQIQSPKRCGIFCLPHTRRWIKSKTSPIALYYYIDHSTYASTFV